MDFYKIYTDEGKKKKYAFGILVSEYPYKKINCDTCGKEWRKELLLDENSSLQICLSSINYPDFASIIYHVIISEKAKEAIMYENITGYQLGTLTIVSKDEISPERIKQLREKEYKVQNISSNPPNYYRLFVERSAELHPKSEVFFEECDVCGYRKYASHKDPFRAEYIKKDSWNGSDLFMVKEFGAVIYCTERFVEVYQKHKLTGLLFKKVESI